MNSHFDLLKAGSRVFKKEAESDKGYSISAVIGV